MSLKKWSISHLNEFMGFMVIKKKNYIIKIYSIAALLHRKYVHRKNGVDISDRFYRSNFKQLQPQQQL